MGKAGRVVCITVPWALTVASFVCLVLIEISGWNRGLVPSYYFMKVNFTDIDVSGASTLENSTSLTLALADAKSSLADIYELHLWNYCSSDSSNGTIDFCSKRHAEYTFDPVTVWHLNSTTPTSTTSSSGALQSAESALTSTVESEEETLLGKSGKEALDVYNKAAKAIFILYAVSFWSSLATIVLGIAAIFSRWGSFFTWIFAFVSSVITLAAVALSTGVYIALVEALRGVLDPYNIHTHLGTHTLVVAWLSVVFSWAGTLFWLCSVCCCSGRSNPHHRSNKGGLWNAEQKGMGYHSRGGLHTEKAGGERAASPFLGYSENEGGDQVPLNNYQEGPAYGHAGGYEPYRHT